MSIENLMWLGMSIALDLVVGSWWRLRSELSGLLSALGRCPTGCRSSPTIDRCGRVVDVRLLVLVPC